MLGLTPLATRGAVGAGPRRGRCGTGDGLLLGEVAGGDPAATSPSMTISSRPAASRPVTRTFLPASTSPSLPASLAGRGPEVERRRWSRAWCRPRGPPRRRPSSVEHVLSTARSGLDPVPDRQTTGARSERSTAALERWRPLVVALAATKVPGLGAAPRAPRGRRSTAVARGRGGPATKGALGMRRRGGHWCPACGDGLPQR